MKPEPTPISRRALLGGITVGGLAIAAPGLAPAQSTAAPTLVLIKLAGGNDGLNTIVPFADPTYRRARPGIGLNGNDLLRLDQDLGLHPGLSPLEDAWAAGDCAIVRGVGYRPADRSHFRGMDVWETGGAPATPLPTGWLTRLLPSAPRSLDMLVIGSDPLVSVAGGDLTAYELSAGAALAPTALTGAAGTPNVANPALAHVLAVERRLVRASAGLADALDRLPGLATAFPEDDLGRRLALAGGLIAGGSPAPVILVPVTGFDTHADQRAVHDGLLAALGAGLAALRAALIEAGRWSTTTIATYSEFGRRLMENGSGGTDHGTAAPHLVLGGGIIGGWHGAQPSLSDLDDRDPIPTTDFRAYLGGVAVAGLDVAPAVARTGLGGIAPIALRTPA